MLTLWIRINRIFFERNDLDNSKRSLS